MRPGIVSTVRVNPKDCMSIVDVMKSAGINPDGMSFAQMVSSVLAGFLEGARENGVVPTRDGFEYADMMGQWIQGRRTATKLAVANAIHQQGSEFKASAIRITGKNPNTAAPYQESLSSPEVAKAPTDEEVRYAAHRLTELGVKKNLAEDNDAVIWSESDQKEYDEHYRKLYPEG